MSNVKSGYVTKKAASGKTYREEPKGGFNAFLKTEGEGKKVVKGFMRRSPNIEQDWRGLIATPPGSVLQRCIDPFRAFTDIPLELPFFGVLHYVSTFLNKNGCSLSSDKIRKMNPFIWNVILAPSGAGKTLSHDWIGEIAPVKSNMPNCGSSAMWFEELKRCKEQDGYASWFCDEWAQKVKMIETPNSPLSEMKENMLKSYNSRQIERATKKTGNIIIQDPTFNFYAVNTEKSFIDSISVESMADGFAQRFGYVYTLADPDRHMTDYALYNEEKVLTELEGAFDKMLTVDLHQNYIIVDEAEQEYEKIFKALFKEDNLPNSFYRRALYKTLTYALLYHVINLKSSQYIDGEDIQWASRVTEMHLNDTWKIFEKKGMGEVRTKMEKVKSQKERFEAKEGRDFKPRDLVQMNRSWVGDSKEAKEILDFLED